jgi:hypothetical protein
MPTLLKRQEVRPFLLSEKTFAATLLVICVDEFGTDFFNWEPDTLRIEAMHTWGIEIPEVNRDKIWALVTCLTTNLFYISVEMFIHVCNALSSSGVDFLNYDPANGNEMAWGLIEVTLIDPPEKGEDDPSRFSHEIKRYIGAQLTDEGMTTPPRILSFAEYDADPENAAGIALEPDPVMANLYSDRQQRSRLEIEQYVVEKLQMLMTELEKVPLTYGSTEKIRQLKLDVQSKLSVRSRQTARAATQVDLPLAP